MEATDLLLKTDAGTDEVKSRSRTLPRSLRTMLIMIDGSMTIGQLQQAAASLSAPPDFVDVLLRERLVELSAPAASRAASSRPPMPEVERFRAARKFMNDTVVDALGLRAFFFSLKIEKCYTRSDLAGLLPDYAKALVKAGDEGSARLLSARAKALIDEPASG